MDIKLEKLNTIRKTINNANDEELMLAFEHVIDILVFITSISEDGMIENVINKKLEKLKNTDDYIYFKAIELVFIENVTTNLLPEILTNLLMNNDSNNIKDYITVLAFSSFSDQLRGEGYNKNLANYLLSHFNVNFLKKNWDYIEEKLNDFN